jgi:hypothetical protein
MFIELYVTLRKTAEETYLALKLYLGIKIIGTA